MNENTKQEGDVLEAVWLVFKKEFESDQVLWKVFSTEEKADKWIKEHGQWATFEVEKWQVR